MNEFCESSYKYGWIYVIDANGRAVYMGPLPRADKSTEIARGCKHA